MDIDECASQPCARGSTCVEEGIGAFKCLCQQGYEGDLCDKDMDECVSSPCENGVCYNFPGTFQCFCQQGQCIYNVKMWIIWGTGLSENLLYLHKHYFILLKAGKVSLCVFLMFVFRNVVIF